VRRIALRAVISASCTALVATAAWAAEPFDGRWAADVSVCASENGAISPIVVTSLALRWGEAACAIRRSYRVKDIWHIGARCWADGATSDVPIKLQIRGERLVLDWAGARPEELQRCP
jgi:hypothetical protein